MLTPDQHSIDGASQTGPRHVATPVGREKRVGHAQAERVARGAHRARFLSNRQRQEEAQHQCTRRVNWPTRAATHTLLRIFRNQTPQPRTHLEIVVDLLTAIIWGPPDVEGFKRFNIPDEQMLDLFHRLVETPGGETPGGCSSTLSPSDGNPPNPASEDDHSAGDRRVTVSINITAVVDPSRVDRAVKTAIEALA